MGIPIEGYDTYYTAEGLNSITLDILNPMGVLANYAVTIEYPVFPSYADETDDQPTFTLADFLIWVRPMTEYLADGEDSSLYSVYALLVEIAKERILWSLVYNEKAWKQLVALYVGHYMELMINSIKDEANHMSLNPFDKEKDYHYETTVGNEVFEDFKTTLYGKMFWFLYVPYGRFLHWGVDY